MVHEVLELLLSLDLRCSKNEIRNWCFSLKRNVWDGVNEMFEFRDSRDSEEIFDRYPVSGAMLGYGTGVKLNFLLTSVENSTPVGWL